MNSAAKLAFAIGLAAVLFFTPLAFCASQHTAPAHSCCPPPVKKDGSRPCCTAGKALPPPATLLPSSEGAATLLPAASNPIPESAEIRVHKHGEALDSPPGNLPIRLHRILI